MKITAIILTYNRPDALKLILQSIIAQSVKPDEVIIADDGSGPETADVVKKFQKTFPVGLQHVWHEDRGFRIAAIRNKAVKESTGDWLLFSDGDLVFHRHFFSDFKRNMQKGKALIGSRVFLKKDFTKKILVSENAKNQVSFFSPRIGKNRLNALRLPFLSGLISDTDFSKRLRGGLLGVWKNDLVSVNGWNEDFESWGKEDTELVARLHHRGIRFRKLKFAGITYHLWHAQESRSALRNNELLLEKCIDKKLTWCSNGLVKSEKS